MNDHARIFAFPRVAGEDRESERLQFFRVQSPKDFQLSRWGIREPMPDGEIIDPTTIDFIIVPGVAFTIAGARLGRGRGHYDRFLPRLRATATIIGVCFRERLLDEIPMDAHDVPMRHVLSA
jgi:5-formyltetrahydrofolate cyclo-ligase